MSESGAVRGLSRAPRSAATDRQKLKALYGHLHISVRRMELALRTLIFFIAFTPLSSPPCRSGHAWERRDHSNREALPCRPCASDRSTSRCLLTR
jgi:hypothetical protein